MVDSGGALTAAERLVTWRSAMIRVLTRILLLVTAPVMLWLTYVAFRVHRPHAILLICVAFVSTLGCTFAPISVRQRAWWLVLHTAIAIAIGTPLMGPVGGLGAMVVLTPLLGVLLLGAREAALVLGLSLLTGFAWLGLAWLGIAPRPSSELSDAGIPSNAARMLFTSGCIALVVMAASSYMIQQLMSTLTEAERLISNLRSEMHAREEETRRRREVEQELMQSQKLEALARLTGGVVHDVNNNLTVALTCADLIERAHGDHEQTERLCASIRDACGSASSLTRQLLALGRRDVSQPELVSLPKWLKHIEGFLRTSLGKHIKLTFAIPEGLPPVLVDPRQLEQVLINLAINARDAMPDGGELRVSGEASATNPSYDLATAANAPSHPVRLHVQDRGTGIPRDVLPHIVDPFFTTKDAEHGTGLGLAVVRAFAEASGGRLCIATRVGHGSCFTLELPAASQPVSQPERPALAHPKAQPQDTSVLVVDDDPRVRQTIALGLEHAGYRVLQAEDGVAALECAQTAGHIDLLCTDAVMPRLGGEELIRRFQELDPRTRVLICSAYVQEKSLRELLNSGHYPALVKPFSEAQLLDSVERALAQA